MKNSLMLTLLFLLLQASFSFAQNNAPLSDKAPTDQPVGFTGSDKLKEFEKQIAPSVKKAKKTLPGAKKRFLAGLPPGEVFFLTVRLYDSNGAFEQVFIRVKEWSADNISGSIANDLNTVKEFKPGQMITFKEKDILDWLISKPNGSEEGNYVGKFLDKQH